MASPARGLLSAANSPALLFPSHRRPSTTKNAQRPGGICFKIQASSSVDDSDGNDEDEVGAASVELIAREETKVVGTYPPRNRGWTGYVDKDTAGQTNIYSVEPSVYVAESAISSGSAGSSSQGSQNTIAITAGIALISVAAASAILLQVGKTPLQVQTKEYSGPSLSYYINKFKPPEMIPASVTVQNETALPQRESSSIRVSEVEVQSGVVEQPST